MFNNIIVHPIKGKAILLPPGAWRNPDEMINDLSLWVEQALDDGTLWCPGGVVVYTVRSYGLDIC